MGITNLQYLRNEAVSMMASLEKNLYMMPASALKIVTAGLTDIRLELEGLKKSCYVDLTADHPKYPENGEW